MMIGMLSFWLIPAAIVWLLHERSQTTSDGGRESARRILEERFARGELDVDEFEKRRSLIDDTTK